MNTSLPTSNSIHIITNNEESYDDIYRKYSISHTYYFFSVIFDNVFTIIQKKVFVIIKITLIVNPLQETWGHIK